MAESLKQKTVKGLGWSALDNAARYGMQFAVCIFWGIMPMLYVNLVVGVVAYFLNSYYSGRQIGYSSWMQVKDIAPSCLVAAIVAVSVFFVKYIPASYLVILPLQIVMGAAVFMVLCQLTRNPEYIEMKTMFAPYLRKVKR